jgi:hypothetical protein
MSRRLLHARCRGQAHNFAESACAQDAQAKRNWRDALLNADTLIGEFTFEARDALQAALEE